MNLWTRLFGSEKEKTDLEAEIEAHLAMAAAEKQDRGADPEAARHEARREFGNITLVKDVTHEIRGWLWLERLGQDLRYAFRQMRRSPGFAATVVGTLALGIGAATAMFTVVDKLLLRAVPYWQPERLVVIHEVDKSGKPGWVPWLDLKQWQEQNHSLGEMAFYRGAGTSYFLEGESGSVQVFALQVSPNFLQVLGIPPALGHGFDEKADLFSGGANLNTVVLSNAAWKQMYGADPEIIGKQTRLNGRSVTVVAVMPPAFTAHFGRPEIWLPLQLGDADKTRTSAPPGYQVVARLKDGISLKKAQADLETIQPQVIKAYSNAELREQRSHIKIQTYADSLTSSDLKQGLAILLAASLVLWLISCVNSANLLLARASARQREIAMRGALGASRWRLIQQLVIEGLLLSSVAALSGSGLALLAVRIVGDSVRRYLAISLSAKVNLGILSAVAGLTLISAVLCTAWPAFLAVCAPIEPALKQGGQQSGTNRGQHRVRSGLVIVEIAMSLTLLAGCGLLLRTIYTLQHVPLGFRTDHIVVANLTIPSWRFANQNMTSDLYRPLLERVQHLPGVQAAGLMTEVPLGNTFNAILTLQSEGNGSDRSHSITAALKAVSPEMQHVFGFTMQSGRFFNEKDTAGSTPVIVVNRAFAQLYAPDKSNPASILWTTLWHLTANSPAHVIGVLDDERQRSITEPSQPEVEVCIPQLTPDSSAYRPVASRAMDIALRTDLPLDVILPQLRKALRQTSPELADANFKTMDQIVADSYGSQTLAARILEIFGGSALLLCIAGLYGLLAYIVSQRTREMGVRIALGARRSNVVWLVLKQAILVVVAGVTIGTVLVLFAGKLIRSYLYGVSTHDAWTLGIVAALIFASGMLAAYLPARRAAGVNPIEALRAE